MKDSQPFAKSKEVFCLRTCRHKNTTFNFAQSHPKPTHHTMTYFVVFNDKQITELTKFVL